MIVLQEHTEMTFSNGLHITLKVMAGGHVSLHLRVTMLSQYSVDDSTHLIDMTYPTQVVLHEVVD